MKNLKTVRSWYPWLPKLFRLITASFCSLLFCDCVSGPQPLTAQEWTVDTEANLQKLVRQEDTDGDKRITIEDKITPFSLNDLDGSVHKIEGVYPLSVLIQELGTAQNAGKKSVSIKEEAIRENPVLRTTRMIRDVFWQGLTRRIDREGLAVTLPDPKMPTRDGYHYLYVPHADVAAYRYFKKFEMAEPQLKMKVLQVPDPLTPQFLKSLDDKHGLLLLHTSKGKNGELNGSPFVVPGGRFNVMYGWDSYFIVLGLLQDGKIEESRAMVDNHVYEATHYGKVLNGNRTYYLTRSQPPFLTSMALAVYEKLPKSAANREWLKKALVAAIKEYRGHWMKPPRFDAGSGLSRYWGEGKGPCPEVHQPKIYEPILGPRAEKLKLSLAAYIEKFKRGEIKDAELDKYFLDDRALRESGHDRTYRFADRTSDFLTVDLNSLLYKVEMDLASTIEKEFGGKMVTSRGVEKARDWCEKAERRKRTVNEMLWDGSTGFYFDYDLARGKRSDYVSATAFYPLWAGLASPTQAQLVLEKAKLVLVEKCGLAATAEISRGPITPEHPKRQWDYPNGWAPHQMLAWVGLMNYGMNEEAQGLAYRWLYGITKNVRDYNGTVPEKLDVKDCSQQMRAGSEFDNVGTEFKYVSNEGFGWMNASYQVGLGLLSPTQLEQLKQLREL